MPELRSQNKFRSQKPELGVRSQNLEVRSRKSVVGSQKLEVRSRKLEVRSQKLEVRSLESEDRSGKSEVGSQKCWKQGIIKKIRKTRNNYKQKDKFLRYKHDEEL